MFELELTKNPHSNVIKRGLRRKINLLEDSDLGIINKKEINKMADFVRNDKRNNNRNNNRNNYCHVLFTLKFTDCYFIFLFSPSTIIQNNNQTVATIMPTNIIISDFSILFTSGS